MKKSDLKEIFEDNSLSDLEKYRKISGLQRKKVLIGGDVSFWNVFIVLNVIIFSLLSIIPKIETDNPNLSPVVVLKD